MNLAPILYTVLLCTAPDSKADFTTQIVPILTKAGCNSGACHGAAAGRGGFHLSLLGSDPAADFEAIVHQFEGRRINLTKPDQSLLLTKPTGYVDHGGETVFDASSGEATMLRRWISDGAMRGEGRRLSHFEVSPRQTVVELGAEPIALRATAIFDNGSPEDVTQYVLFTPVDNAAIELDLRSPAARLKRSGQHIVIARYLDRVVPIELLVPFSPTESALSYPFAKNFIDEEILRCLRTLRIPASPLASDAEFLRRVSLDLTGRLPSIEFAEAFPRDQAPDKRERLVDSLLASESFVEYWTLRLSRALQLHSLPNDKKCAEAYANWIRGELRRNTPLSEFAAALLTATGDSHTVGPANFARMVSDAREHAELAGRFFLGVRLGCANCHNHPLDRWTQDDFHGFAAVFSRLDRNQMVQVLPRGSVTNLRTGEPATPRIPGIKDLVDPADPRRDVAEWLTDSEDRQFARAMVNRLWQAMMGRGLVEPIDDMRETNPPTNPQLLNRLANDFADHHYDLRHTLRLIALSTTYSLGQGTNASNFVDDRFHSHAYSKPLLPEVLADAVADVLGVANELGGQASGTRAQSIVDPREPARTLDLLGRCDDPRNCQSSRVGSGLATQLHVLSGDFINHKFESIRSTTRQVFERKLNDKQIVQEFYLRALSRQPTKSEILHWTPRIHHLDEVERRRNVEDFVWALLASRAFAENH